MLSQGRQAEFLVEELASSLGRFPWRRDRSGKPADIRDDAPIWLTDVILVSEAEIAAGRFDTSTGRKATIVEGFRICRRWQPTGPERSRAPAVEHSERRQHRHQQHFRIISGEDVDVTQRGCLKMVISRFLTELICAKAVQLDLDRDRVRGASFAALAP